MAHLSKRIKLDGSIIPKWTISCDISGVPKKKVIMAFDGNVIKFWQDVLKEFEVPDLKRNGIKLAYADDANREPISLLSDEEEYVEKLDWSSLKEYERHKELLLCSHDSDASTTTRPLNAVQRVGTFMWQKDNTIKYHQKRWSPDERFFTVGNSEIFKFQFCAPAQSVCKHSDWQLWFECHEDGSQSAQNFLVQPVDEEKEQHSWEEQDGVWKLTVKAGNTYERKVQINAICTSVTGTLKLCQTEDLPQISPQTQWTISESNIRPSANVKDIFGAKWCIKLQLSYEGCDESQTIAFPEVKKDSAALKHMTPPDAQRLQGNLGAKKCKFRRLPSCIVGFLHTFPNSLTAGNFLDTIPDEPHLSLSVDLREGPGAFEVHERKYLAKMFQRLNDYDVRNNDENNAHQCKLMIGEVEINRTWSLYLVPSNYKQAEVMEGQSGFSCYLHQTKMMERIIERFGHGSGKDKSTEPFTIVLDLDGTVLYQKPCVPIKDNEYRILRTEAGCTEFFARPHWVNMRKELLEQRQWHVHIASRSIERHVKFGWDFLKKCGDGRNLTMRRDKGGERIKTQKVVAVPSGGMGGRDSDPPYEMKSLLKLGLLPAERAFTVILDDKKYNRNSANWASPDLDDCMVPLKVWKCVPCTYCNEHFEDRRQQKEHEKQCKIDFRYRTKFRCEYESCKKEFQNKNEFDAHVKRSDHKFNDSELEGLLDCIREGKRHVLANLNTVGVYVAKYPNRLKEQIESSTLVVRSLAKAAKDIEAAKRVGSLKYYPRLSTPEPL